MKLLPTQVIRIKSPDGFDIDSQRLLYYSQDEAKAFFLLWKERFIDQGYYSSVKGKIPLDNLVNHCSFDIVEKADFAPNDVHDQIDLGLKVINALDQYATDNGYNGLPMQEPHPDLMLEIILKLNASNEA